MAETKLQHLQTLVSAWAPNGKGQLQFKEQALEIIEDLISNTHDYQAQAGMPTASVGYIPCAICGVAKMDHAKGGK